MKSNLNLSFDEIIIVEKIIHGKNWKSTMKRTPLRRSPFKRKASHKGFKVKDAQNALKRKTEASPVKTRKPIKAQGKRGKEWSSARSSIKKFFFENNILYCELNFAGCTKIITEFAHSMKRRKLGKWGSEEREHNLYEVAGVCRNCHNIIEGADDMLEHVQNAIKRREQSLIDILSNQP